MVTQQKRLSKRLIIGIYVWEERGNGSRSKGPNGEEQSGKTRQSEAQEVVAEKNELRSSAVINVKTWVRGPARSMGIGPKIATCQKWN